MSQNGKFGDAAVRASQRMVISGDARHDPNSIEPFEGGTLNFKQKSSADCSTELFSLRRPDVCLICWKAEREAHT